MIPGITNTECRIAEFRYGELLAEGDRQRRAASSVSVPAARFRVMETIQRYIGAGLEQVGHLLRTVRTQETTNASAAPGTLGMK